MHQIVDSHVHFWDPEQLKYSWLENVPSIDRAFLTDHVPAQVGDAVIEGIVFVQADCAKEQGLDEVDFVTELAQKDARVQAIVAFAPLDEPEGLSRFLDELKKRPLVKGVRRLIQDEPLGFSLAPNFTAGVQFLASYGFSFDICCKHPQLPDVIQLVRACPKVNFVLDHIGKPDIKNHLLDPWRADISELATLPNIRCKLSGLVTEADHARWTQSDLQPYIEHVITAFGTDRVMFGSDAPVEYLASTYDRWVQTLQNVTGGLPDGDKEKLWSKNAQEFYRIAPSN